MRCLLPLLLLAAAAAAAAAADDDAFRAFVQRFNRTYAGPHEQRLRAAIFHENVALAQALNARHGGATYGVTKFMDLSRSEFRRFHLNARLGELRAARAQAGAPVMPPAAGPLPQSFDWRQKGAVTPVKDQGQCGSCWAFSTTETIESAWFLAGNPLTKLSVQQIVDCDQGRGDQGCNGGDTPTAYQYVIAQGGLDTDTAYPYAGVDQQCAFQRGAVAAKIRSWKYITQNKNETQMLYGLVQGGPLSICVDAASWQFYVGGIIQYECGTDLDHCVQITGFDTMKNWLDESTPVWVVRNSWGTDWGENGYLYVERNYDLCGIADEVTLPVV